MWHAAHDMVAGFVSGRHAYNPAQSHERMTLENALTTFTPDEFAVAQHLQEHGRSSVEDITRGVGIDALKARRAVQWLAQKGFVKTYEVEHEVYVRTELGDRIATEGLPERRLLASIGKKGSAMDSLRTAVGDGFNAAIGTLKKAGAIEMGATVTITEAGSKLLKSGFSIEKELSVERAQKVAPELLERGFFTKETIRTLEAQLVPEAKKLDYTPLDLIEQLTPEMIRDKTYEGKAFRVYDVSAVFPTAKPGRRHFINEATDFVRTVWLDMGFSEMRGDMVQTGFWNFDALFTPQDHPARDEHDTFFVKKPASGQLPDAKLVGKVSKTHVDGWTTGSIGYAQSWSKREARRNVLRTHTTCISAQTLSQLDINDLPAKFFSVDTVFRNETLDWKHLFEFHQVEGIVIDKKITFANLKAYLEVFFRKLGYDRIRLRPAYFPYTEPSIEVDVFHPTRGEWIELGGAGIFRPEVSKPLIGRDYPVAAWGLGFGRIISEYYAINDLREFSRNDLEQIRHARGWV
jgi:phenylalanyl-tRNA synthetase alpha chain